MTETVVDVEDLAFTYRGANAPTLAGVSLQVHQGEVMGLLGPSGAGKSTLQRVLTGLLRGYRGSVRVLGREISAWGRQVYERLGVSFETPVSFGTLTLRENLAYTARLYSRPTRPPEQVLAAVGLADDAGARAAHMSKGMGVRLNVARALLHDPELVFLDEPTSGLDPVGVARMEALIASLRERGRSVVITTHDMVLARQACDRVGFVVDGRLVEVGAPQSLCERHGTREVRVTWPGGGGTYPLDHLADDARFHADLRAHGISTIHSREADLAQVFATVTGRPLS